MLAYPTREWLLIESLTLEEARPAAVCDFRWGRQLELAELGRVPGNLAHRAMFYVLTRDDETRFGSSYYVVGLLKPYIDLRPLCLLGDDEGCRARSNRTDAEHVLIARFVHVGVAPPRRRTRSERATRDVTPLRRERRVYRPTSRWEGRPHGA